MARSKTGWLFLGSAFVLALAGVTPAVYAHGGDPTLVHACVDKRGGKIKIVGANASCKGNKTALDWNLPGAAGPEVLDANGVQVGDLVGVHEVNARPFPVVALKAADTTVFLAVGTDRIFSTTGGAYFEALNCTGTPLWPTSVSFAPLTASSMVPSAVVIDNRLFVASSTGAMTLTTQSFFGDATNTCSNFSAPGGTDTYFPMTQILDLSTLFAPPFGLQ